MNRDLKRVICIDWDVAAVSGYPENMLLILQWTGDDNDMSLVDLAEMLRGISGNFFIFSKMFSVILATNPDDVQPILQHYAQVDNPAKYFHEASKKLVNFLRKTLMSKSTWPMLKTFF